MGGGVSEIENWDDELNRDRDKLSLKEFYEKRDKLFFEWTPSNSDSFGTRAVNIRNLFAMGEKINPSDKKSREKNLNPHEENEFGNICEYGGIQLVRCYGSFDREFTKIDFMTMCIDCPYLNRNYAIDYLEKLTDEVSAHWEIKRQPRSTKRKPSYVYFISNGTHVKIGVADYPKRRIKELQTGASTQLSILKTIQCKDREEAMRKETELHFKYSDKNTCGEWFDILDELIKESA